MTSARIARDLRALGVRPGETLLVHTSLSALSGPRSIVVGGAIAVIEALEAALGPAGTLVMPAFTTDYSDPATWKSPPLQGAWWDAVREGMPAWRPDRARTFGVGIVPETFRALRTTRRSLHPQHSFCAAGPEAEAIVRLRTLDDPLGPDGPLGALRARAGRVLLLGCGFGNCTAFHLAEHERPAPPPRITESAPVWLDGRRTWARWSQPAYDATSFAALGERFAREPCVRRGPVADAAAYLFDLGEAVSFAVRVMSAG